MNQPGYGKVNASAGGRFRRLAIFTVVTAAVGTGIYFTLPKNAVPPVPAAASPAPSVKTALPGSGSSASETFSAGENVPAAAGDPDPVIERAPGKETAGLPAPEADPETAKAAQETTVPVPEEKTASAIPVRKGIAHVTDPADEGPYCPPDSLEPGGFAENMHSIRTLLEQGKVSIAAARTRNLLKETNFASEQFREAAKLLNEISRKEPASSGGREIEYIVRSGDSLIRLARHHRLTPAALAAANGIPANAGLRIGQKLKIPVGSAVWMIRIRKRARLLELFRDKDLTAVYDVGIGRRDSTPAGRFVLRETVSTPLYPLPGGGMAPAGSPENQLGACWLGLGDSLNRPTGYGIHGTPDEKSVSASISSGCIRMRNAEVVELASRVPEGTFVLIEN